MRLRTLSLFVAALGCNQILGIEEPTDRAGTGGTMGATGTAGTGNPGDAGAGGTSSTAGTGGGPTGVAGSTAGDAGTSGAAGTGGGAGGTAGAAGMTGAAGTGGMSGRGGGAGTGPTAGTGGGGTAGTGGAAGTVGTGGRGGGSAGTGGGAGTSGRGGGGATGGGGAGGTGGPTDPCTVPAIDIRSVQVTGTITVNGAPLTSNTDYGNLYLRNADGDNIFLAASYTGTYTVRVVPGTYDVFYAAATSGGTAPRNSSVKVGSVLVASTGTTTAPIDIRSAQATGTITINGVPVTAMNDYGNLSLKTAAGDNIFLANTYTGTYTVRVVPGTYDVFYTAASIGTMVPRNNSVKVGTVIVADTGTTTAPIDIKAAQVTGTITVNGAPLVTTSDYGNLYLKTAAGDNIFLANTYTGTYTVRVVPGSYDAVYVVGAAGAMAPRNAATKVGTVTVADTGTTTAPIDVKSAQVTGAITINGAAVTSMTDYGNLTLRAPGENIFLGNSFTGSYSVRVVPGSYDVFYAAAAIGASVPRNNSAKLGTVLVADTGTTNSPIDIKAAYAIGTITINGAVAGSATDYGNLYLKNATGDNILLAGTHTGAYNTRVVPGSYDVVYVVASTSTVAPRNANAKVGTVTVAATGTTQAPIDVRSVPVSGAITINGAAPPGMTDYGTLTLRSPGENIFLANTFTASYSLRVVPGSYDVFYVLAAGGTSAPRNTSGKLRCYLVP